MSIMTRLCALGALSVLAACGSSESAMRANDTLSAAAVYAPSYDDGLTTTADIMESNVVGDGIKGHIGMSDGTVKAVLIRLSEDETEAYISIDGGPEEAFTTRTSGVEGDDSGRWTDDAFGELFLNLWNSDRQNRFDYDSVASGEGFFGLQTSPDALPETLALYSGWADVSGEDGGAYMNIVAQADFQNSSIGGYVAGSFFGDFSYEERSIEERASPDFFGALAGDISGSEVAMSADVSGSDVNGTIDMLGAFYDDARVIAGGIGATLNGTTLGGDFQLYEGFID